MFWDEDFPETMRELADEFWKDEIFRDQRRQYSTGEKVVARAGTQLVHEFVPVAKKLQPVYEQSLVGTIIHIWMKYSREYLVDFGQKQIWCYGDEIKLAISYDDLVAENRRLRTLLIALLQR